MSYWCRSCSFLHTQGYGIWYTGKTLDQTLSHLCNQRVWVGIHTFYIRHLELWRDVQLYNPSPSYRELIFRSAAVLCQNFLLCHTEQRPSIFNSPGYIIIAALISLFLRQNLPFLFLTNILFLKSAAILEIAILCAEEMRNAKLGNHLKEKYHECLIQQIKYSNRVCTGLCKPRCEFGRRWEQITNMGPHSPLNPFH